MKPKIGIIGYGNIGQEVEKQVLKKDWVVSAIARTSGIYNSKREKIDELENWREHFKKVDITVLCIPTLDDGTIAYYYIDKLLENGIPVVTSEKGAWGNYGPELKPWKAKIGHSAVVGGGTRIIHWIKERLSPETKQIHLIINGTLNDILDGVSRGRTIDEMIDEVKKLGYAEPGAKEVLEVINTEAGRDVPMKTAALINLCDLGEIRAKDIEVQNLDEKYKDRLEREAVFRRYIVSFTKKENEEDVIGGFHFKINDWYVSGGFKNRTQNPLFLQLVPPGVNNAALIYGPEGSYINTGPGAGPEATVRGSIMWDIENLLK